MYMYRLTTDKDKDKDCSKHAGEIITFGEEIESGGREPLVSRGQDRLVCPFRIGLVRKKRLWALHVRYCQAPPTHAGAAILS